MNLEVSDDVILEITLHLNCVSIVRLLSCSRRFWKLSNNPLVQDRIVPYRKYIKYKQWNKLLIEAVAKFNFPEIIFAIENGAEDFKQAVMTSALHGNKKLIEYFSGLESISMDTWGYALTKAVTGNHEELACEILNLKDDEGKSINGLHIDYTIREASINGNRNLLNKLLEKRSERRKYLDVLLGASEGGHKDLIDLAEKNGQCYWSAAFYHAVKGGHKDLCEYFWNKQSRSIQLATALQVAGSAGRLDIAEWIINEKGGDCVNAGLWGAVQGGRKDAVDYFISKGADSNSFLSTAAQVGNIDLVKFFIEKGNTHFNAALVEACQYDHREVILLLLDHGATDLDKGLVEAAGRGHTSLAELLIDRGATNLDEVLEKASSAGWKSTVKLLMDRGAQQHQIK